MNSVISRDLFSGCVPAQIHTFGQVVFVMPDVRPVNGKCNGEKRTVDLDRG